MNQSKRDDTNIILGFSVLLVQVAVCAVVTIIIILVEYKLAHDLVKKVFVSLFWVSHVPMSHGTVSDRTAEHLCVEQWDFPWSPEHYSIAIELDPSNQTFNGKVSIEGEITNATAMLELNCESLTIHRVALGSTEVRTFFIDEDVLRIELSKPLDVGTKFILEIDYAGIFHESLGVIMKSFQNNSYMVATNLEPISARRVFPCIDFPRYKATFEVAVKRPGGGLQVLSNMPEKNPSDSESDWVRFQRTPKMSTYLVAFIVTDYVPFKVDGSRHNLTTDISIWVPRKKLHSKAVKWAAALTSELLFHLQNFINATFTLPKIDLLATPPFEENVGGMENWGLIVIREKSLMAKKRSTVSEEMEIIYTITHELAHDWFGNLVTVEDWCSVWIQEALSSYMQAIIPTQAFANVDMVNLEKWYARDFVLSQECQSTELRSLNMNKKGNVSVLFDVTDYHKGAAVLFMLESVVTRSVFRQALQDFISNHQYGYVTDFDLWEAVQNSADAADVQLPSAVDDIMSSWVNVGGHPIVHVNRDGNGTVTVSQTQCSTNEASEFWIPLTYTTKPCSNFEETKPKLWMSGEEAVTTLNITLHPRDWIILNIQNSGVYRVNYDPVTWSLLARQLKHNHSAIHPANRALLLDDAFYLASAGLIPYSVPLKIMAYLGNEGNAYVWEVVNNYVWKMADNKLPREELELLKKYVETLLDGVYQNVADWGSYDRDLWLYEERKLRGVIYALAGLVNYRRYREDALTFIENVAAKRINNKTGFCECAPQEVSEHSMWSIALADGPPSLFNMRVEHYERVEDPELKSNIAEEIMQSTSNVTRLLLWVGNTPMNDMTWEHYVKIFQDTWPTNCEELWAYLQVHWRKLNEAYGLYYKFMEDHDQDDVVPTPVNKEDLVNLLQRFIYFPSIFDTLTPNCSNLTEQVFNVTRSELDAENYSLRSIIGHDVLIWLRRHTQKST